jgi:cell fate regulator YaaT (PSP1 superfamily)
MDKIIGVQFQKNGKMYYFDANGFEPKPGEYIIVDTSRGIDLGEVVMGIRDIDESLYHTPLKKTIRIATEQDIQHGVDNREKEKEAFVVCQQKITEHKLEMKLVSVEYAFDNSKILFFFTANGRVDFRSLVKDLASIFKMRIELRQIGVRDEAKMLGGLGPCGRTICCGSFLDQFQPVSIKMAKEQNLSLNPTKISGVCGRLMCCLKYEQEHYEQTRKKMPKVGKTVTTPDGNGPVTDLNIVKETVFVRLADGDSSEIKEYPLEMITGTDQGIYHESIQKDNNQNTQNDTESVQLSEQSEKTTDNNQEDSAEAIRHEAKATTQKNRHRQKGKTQRNQQLGQPVRRENPNRMIAVQEGNNDSVTSNNIASNQNVEVTQNTSPWADALQKAIRAIQSDN